MASQFVKQAKDSANTQNNLNPQQGVVPLLKRHTETLLTEEAYTVAKQNDVTDMAIWDNPNSTWDGVGTDDEWDSYSDSGNAIVQISNPNNIFIERFRFETVKDTPTDATWSTANGNVTFTTGQVLQLRCFLDTSGTGWPTAFGTWGAGSGTTFNVTTVTPRITIDSGSFTIEASADGGSNWQTLTNNTLASVTNTGDDLRLRITELSAGWPTAFGTWGTVSGGTGTISLVKLEYTL
jgi:hypothetical protein